MAKAKQAMPSPDYDEFVRKVVLDPKSPPEPILLSGYAGPGLESTHLRLYFNLNLTDYVDVPTDKILHQMKIPASESPMGGFYLWIEKDAQLLHGKAGGERLSAEWLKGRIQYEYQRRQEGQPYDPGVKPTPGGVAPIPPESVLYQCGRGPVPGTMLPDCQGITIQRTPCFPCQATRIEQTECRPCLTIAGDSICIPCLTVQGSTVCVTCVLTPCPVCPSQVMCSELGPNCMMGGLRQATPAAGPAMAGNVGMQQRFITAATVLCDCPDPFTQNTKYCCPEGWGLNLGTPAAMANIPYTPAMRGGYFYNPYQ